jgi:hypothetical protein
MTLLAAFDPGYANFGYAIVEVTKPRVLYNGMNSATIRHLTKEGLPEIAEYKEFLTYLIKTKKCSMLIAERFQSRGLQGNSGELVSFMLGIANVKFPKMRVIIASQWKTAYARAGLDLKQFYVDMRPITPHQIDAALIGLYGACKATRRPMLDRKVFEPMIRSTAVIADKVPRVRKAKKKTRIKNGSSK